ncbi:MAG: peptide-methionine (S)-S-oxide reductase MsrA [Patescibacteria group bacterium]
MFKIESKQKDIAVFGAGCFWCTEAVFQNLNGVSVVLPGYTGGDLQNPSYEQVSSGSSGHVEAAKIEFDPGIISFKQLLEVFFAVHDPTTLNRQGNDAGEQYQSAIFYTSENQKQIALNIIREVDGEKIYNSPIVTKVRPLKKFYVAENYHQNYYINNPGNPYCAVVIDPKVQKLRAKFTH